MACLLCKLHLCTTIILIRKTATFFLFFCSDSVFLNIEFNSSKLLVKI
uniref:Uncharacterized protein n=1 Tax=Arundo donax TaxID=35708 RepID=A0A0A9H8B0_ARUDO